MESLENISGISETDSLETMMLALMIVDIDKFKNVNDTYGHEAGDAAIRRTAAALTECFRSDDYIIRYGGDEFVVIMVDIERDRLELIRKKVGHMNDLLQNPEPGQPAFSVSAGMAYSDKGYTKNLFSEADRALYRVKENGRCGCEIYG